MSAPQFEKPPASLGYTLAEITAQQLRQAIKSGSLKPGSRLVEQDIADELSISRVPVREAIQKLAEEGLVRKIPRHGTFVHTPSVRELEEMASLRVVLEQFAVKRILDRWDPRIGTRLRWLLDDLHVAINNRDFDQVLEVDREFHMAMCESADHHLLEEIVASLYQRITQYLLHALAAQKDTPSLDLYVLNHMKIIEAMESGDTELAQQAVEQHIMHGSLKVILAHMGET